MIQSPPLASMLPFHHAMQVAAAQVRKIILERGSARLSSIKNWNFWMPGLTDGTSRKDFWSLFYF